jgi:nucleotide-binding universal stress UspA family protein
MLDTRSILVPTDFSSFADKALELAMDIAKHNKADIRLLHVIDSVQQCAADYCLADEVVRGIKEKSTSETLANFKKETAKFTREGVEITREIREGVPYEEILKDQKARGADLIVMSSHGKTGLRKYFNNSVSDRIMRDSPCNVVLVRT